ncbi:MAG TPA: ABC transporter permease [Verrucomicrobiae bacterium]|jgi:NitT/TauT family transport system permease protein|nr:ABC transporter permease [Verrucomicrobiae bacterium]
MASSELNTNESSAAKRRARTRAVVSIIGGLILWEFLARTVLTNRLVIVPLSTVLEALWVSARTGELWKNLSVSLIEFVLGFGLAAVAGIFLGFVTGTSRAMREHLEPLISALYATPLVALIPFYILVFGIQLASKVALVFTIAVFPILINTQAGLLGVERNLLEVAASFRASRRQVFFKVQLPAAIPFIVSGLRLGVGRALTGVVVGELFFATAGLGFMISIAAQGFDTAKVLLGVLLFALAGVAAIGILQVFEKRMAPWRTT